jgi:hypothetical protein
MADANARETPSSVGDAFGASFARRSSSSLPSMPARRPRRLSHDIRMAAWRALDRRYANEGDPWRSGESPTRRTSAIERKSIATFVSISRLARPFVAGSALCR